MRWTESTRRRGGYWLLLMLTLGGFGEGAPARAEPAEFVLDPEHTSITFFTHHLGFADIAGMFLEAEGSFRFDEATRELSEVRIVVPTASVFTNHERRDRHLRSSDFLNVEEFRRWSSSAGARSRRASATGG